MGYTLAEKIIKEHIVDGEMVKGTDIGLRIDQTLTQDATGTMAYLEFEAMGVPRVKTEKSVAYIDHNTLQTGFENADDHRFIQSVCKKHGIYFSKPGNGICHQVHLERFGKPGKTLIGSDSHTPTGGGIGMGFSDSMENATLDEEYLIDPKRYHTIKESKNGMGPAPIKTKYGWLNVAHGVRNTAAGLRYVLYCFMTSLEDPRKVTHRPSGYFLAPEGAERVGDVSNVVFSNGLIAKDNGDVYIYYASSDTRCHVLTTTVDQLVDYVMNTPEDPHTSYECVQQRIKLIRANKEFL